MSEFECRIPTIPVEIVKVIELEGAFGELLFYSSGTIGELPIYAHVSVPVQVGEGLPKQYALLAGSPQHGLAYLGTIDPQSRHFSLIDPLRPAFYERTASHVVNRMFVPADQLHALPTIDEVLKIQGLRIKREVIPETPNADTSKLP